MLLIFKEELNHCQKLSPIIIPTQCLKINKKVSFLQKHKDLNVHAENQYSVIFGAKIQTVLGMTIQMRHFIKKFKPCVDLKK